MANDILRIQNFLLRFIGDIHTDNISTAYDNVHKVYGDINLPAADQVLLTQGFLNAISNNSPSLTAGAFSKIRDLGILEQNLEIYLAKEIYKNGADGLPDPKSKEIYVLDFDDPINRAITERGYLKLDEINIKKIGRNAEERLRNLEGSIKLKFTNLEDFENKYAAIHISQFKKTIPPGTAPNYKPFSIKELMYSNISSLKKDGRLKQLKDESGPENTKFLILVRFREVNGASGDDHPFINYLNKKQLLLSVNSFKHTFNFADNDKMNMALSNDLTIVFTSYVETVARDSRTIYSNIFDAVDPVLSGEIKKIKDDIKRMQDYFLQFCKDNPTRIDEAKNVIQPQLEQAIKTLQAKAKTAEAKFYGAFDNNVRVYRYKVDEKQFNIKSELDWGTIGAIALGVILLFIPVVGEIELLSTAGAILYGLGAGITAGGVASAIKQGGFNAPGSANLKTKDFINAVNINSNGGVQIYAANNKAVSANVPLDGTPSTLSNGAASPNNSLTIDSGKINVDFFYLGDLMNMLYSYQPTYYDEEILLTQVPFYKPTLVPQNGITDIPIPVNIGDIPISYELFVQFVNQEIFQKKVDFYPVELFIDKLLNLVESTFANLYFGNSSVSINWTKCSFARDVLSLPNDNPTAYNNNIFNQSFIRKNRSLLANTPTLVIAASGNNKLLSDSILNNAKKTNYFSFYKIYRSNLYKYRSTNFYTEFITQNPGSNTIFNDEATIDNFIEFLNNKYYIAGFPIVYAKNDSRVNSFVRVSRKFQFSRIDLPGLKEAQLVNDKFKGYFREPYNVSAQFSPLTFLFFETGTPFFCITPPNILSKDIATQNIGNVLGLGGLYIATEIEGSFKFIETSCVRLDTSRSECKVKGIFTAYGDGTPTPYDAENPETSDCVTKLTELEAEAKENVEKPAENTSTNEGFVPETSGFMLK